jgi:Multicopper oxidase
MNQTIFPLTRWLPAVMAMLLFAAGWPAWAAIDGITGPVFNLTARAGYISAADGDNIYNWGYANGAGNMQYPGPTLIVNQGDTVTIHLRNELPVPVSIVFPGQQGVTAAGGSPGLLTAEAPADNGATVVSYTFTAGHAGTYHYHSGTQPALQAEMGLVGALIVRPANVADPLHQAYAHPGTAFAREHLFMLTEIDPKIHQQVEALAGAGLPIDVDTSVYQPVLWFINGRNAPDTMLEAGVPWLPTQPYNSMPRMHPGVTCIRSIPTATTSGLSRAMAGCWKARPVRDRIWPYRISPCARCRAKPTMRFSSGPARVWAGMSMDTPRANRCNRTNTRLITASRFRWCCPICRTSPSAPITAAAPTSAGSAPCHRVRWC